MCKGGGCSQKRSVTSFGKHLYWDFWNFLFCTFVLKILRFLPLGCLFQGGRKLKILILNCKIFVKLVNFDGQNKKRKQKSLLEFDNFFSKSAD